MPSHDQGGRQDARFELQDGRTRIAARDRACSSLETSVPDNGGMP
jgi:hypothetical protein